MMLKLILLLIVAGLANCGFKYENQFGTGYNAFITIPIDTEITNGWTGEFEFDDTVQLHFYTGAKIVTNKGDKLFSVANDQNTIKVAKGTLELKIEVKWLNNPGADLIRVTFQGKNVDIGTVVTGPPKATVPSIGSKGNYDYARVLHASLLFYEAQRSGKLPADNRILWRKDSMLNDKGDGGEDLSGGYFDAGDLVKFGFPMAYAMTVIAWGVVDYEDAYTKAGELENVRKAIKWGTDYFINAHPKDDVFFGQVGNGGEDHGVWSRPEDWPTTKKRPAYKVTASNGGSDLLGETAAAMAAASIVFKKSDSAYSTKLLTHAKSLYKFADQKHAKYTGAISDASAYYESWSGYWDELAWAAAWLNRATGEASYLADVDKHWANIDFAKDKISQFSWDDKRAGVQLVMAKLTNDTKWKTNATAFADWLVNTAPKSPKGMIYLDQWGPLRHAANAAWITLQTAELGVNQEKYRTFAKNQIGYALGDTGRSFVVGIGTNPPQKPHHRASSCPHIPIPCDFSNAMQNPGPNPNILTGALVGGPDKDDKYEDKRDDYIHNEVAMDYNAGFQSAVAALLKLKGSGYF